MRPTQTQRPTSATRTARLPAIAAGIVVAVVMTTNVLGWPTRPAVPNEETTAGIIVRTIRASDG